MDIDTIEKIYSYLIEYGQKDNKFKLGDIIQYDPSEIKKILLAMPTASKDNSPLGTTSKNKPPLGAKNYFIVAGSRISELAKAIDNYSSNITTQTNIIRKWAEEIVEQCNMVEYLNE